MQEAVTEAEQGQRFDKCTRCLQPVPVRAARCPECGHPHRSRRWIPLAIGTLGLIAIVFVMGLMYYAAWRADLANGEVPADADGAQPEIMVQVPDNSNKSAPPPAPEKKPPLNDK